MNAIESRFKFCRTPLVVYPLALALLVPFNSGTQAQEVITWGSNAPRVPDAATNVVAVAATYYSCLGLRSDGSLVGWDASSSRVPAEGTNVVKIAATRTQYVALKDDGTVIYWTYGKAATLLDTAEVVDIAAGFGHCLALKRDGTVVAWSDNSNGQCDVPSTLTNVAAVSCGATHSVAMLSNGSLVYWGRPPTGHPSTPRGVVGVIAGSSYDLAIRPDGRLTGWGRLPRARYESDALDQVVSLKPTDDFVLALNAAGNVSVLGGTLSIPAGVTNIVDIGASATHCVALRGNAGPRFLGPIQFLDRQTAGSALPLYALAAGSRPITYTWLADGSIMSSSLSPNPPGRAILGSDAVKYQVVASNAFGAITSSVASVSVSPLVLWGDKASLRLAPPPAADKALAVSAGAFHVLSLSENGTVTAWGKNTDGQCTVPPDATNVTAVAAGGNHSLALRADGSITAWGRNWHGEVTVPGNATNIVAIAAGLEHSLALRANGTVLAWGGNDYGQTEVSILATGIKAIAAGYYHNLALRSDGSVVSWGSDYSVPAEATNVVSIAAGREHSLALRQDGTVIGWGDNQFGQSEPPVGLSNVVAIAAGCYHSIALRNDGTLVSWGNNKLGATNPPVGLPDIASIAAGEDYQMALCGAGLPRFGVQPQVVSASTGATAVFTANFQAAYPAQLQWFRDGSAIAGATNRTLTIASAGSESNGSYTLSVSNALGTVSSGATVLSVLADPQVITAGGGWGNNAYRQCDVFQATHNPRALSAGSYHALAINEDGTASAWGKNADGQTTVPITATNLSAIAAGGNHSLALRADGSVVAWGRNWDGQTNVPATLTNAIAIAAGSAHNLALRVDGTVVAWGNNEYGQSDVPPNLPPAIAVAAGYNHSLALLADRTVAVWGAEEQVPMEATNVVGIAGGWWHSLAVRADGTVVAWGDNRYGQCEVPKEATNVVAVAAGWWHSLAIKRDGTVLAWGAPYWGVTNVPAGLRDVVAVAAGEDYSLALVRTGPPVLSANATNMVAHAGEDAVLNINASGTTPLVYQWVGPEGAIAGATNNSLVLRSVLPAQGGTYTVWVTNATGQTASQSLDLAVVGSPQVKPLGKLYRPPGSPVLFAPTVYGSEPMNVQWQYNGQDLLEDSAHHGVGTKTLLLPSVAPEQSGIYSIRAVNALGTLEETVADLTVTPVIAWGDSSAGQLTRPADTEDVVAVSAGERHSVALLLDGRIIAWGDNAQGQTNWPGGVTNAIAVAAGGAHSLALLADGSVIGWGDNSAGQLQIPRTKPAVAIAAGGRHSLALLEDGTVVGWGENILGQTNIPANATNIVAIAAGRTHSLALASDGKILAWGRNWAVPAQAQDAIAIAAGDRHSLALLRDGSVVQWTYYGVVEDVVPISASNVVGIAAGGEHSLALRRDGTLVGWGGDNAGELQIPGFAAVFSRVAAGGAHSLALSGTKALQTPAVKSYEIIAGEAAVLIGAQGHVGSSNRWFHNGALLSSETNNWLMFPRVHEADAGTYELVSVNVTGVESRQSFSLSVVTSVPFLRSSFTEKIVAYGQPLALNAVLGGEPATSLQWQLNGTNLVEDGTVSGTQSLNLQIAQMTRRLEGEYRLLASNQYGTAELAVARLHFTTVVAWGRGPAETTVIPLSATNVIAVTAGTSHSLALRTDGTVIAWGDNAYGQTNVPASATNVISIAAGPSTSFALRSDGTVVGWGNGVYGQTNIPAEAIDVVSLTAGLGACVAARAEAGLVGWGSAVLGRELSLPSNVSGAVGVWLPGNTGVGLNSNGTLFLWGGDQSGTLAYGPPPPGVTDVSAIAAGWGHVLAVRHDGSVAAWGQNAYGQTSLPSSATNMVSIGASMNDSFGIRADGTPLFWGAFAWVGQSGGYSNLVALASGAQHYVGLLNDSTTRTFTPFAPRMVPEGGRIVLVAPHVAGEVNNYRWYQNGVELPGATNVYLIIQPFNGSRAGTYQAIVSNPLRTITGPATRLELGGSPLAFEGPVSIPGENSMRLHLGGVSGTGMVVLEMTVDFIHWQPVLTNTTPAESSDLNWKVDTTGPAKYFRAWQVR